MQGQRTDLRHQAKHTQKIERKRLEALDKPEAIYDHYDPVLFFRASLKGEIAFLRDLVKFENLPREFRR